MEFGDRLLALLNERNISQRDFAAALNIAPTTLNGYVRNKRQPDFALVKQIAFSLNVSIDYLLDYNNSNTALNVYELSLIAKIRDMSDSDRQIIYDLVNLMDSRNKQQIVVLRIFY